MVKCNFCGNELQRGSGRLFARKDGTILYFCSGKCEKNTLKLGRKATETKWTDSYNKLKQTMLHSKGKEEKKESKPEEKAKSEAKEKQ